MPRPPLELRRSGPSRAFALWAAAFVAALALSSSLAYADTIHLKNGKQMKGEIIEETEEYVVIRVPFGQVKVRQDDIDYVDRQTPEENKVEIGRDLLAQQRYGMAIDELEKTIKSDANSKEAGEELARAYLAYGKHLLKVRRLDEAKSVFVKLRALDSNCKEAAEALKSIEGENRSLDGIIEQARGKAAQQDLDGAIAAYDQALGFAAEARERVAQELARCLARRGDASYQAKNYDAALADLERAFGLDSRLTGPLDGLYASAALARISSLLNNGQLQTAQRYLQRVLVFAPTNPTVLYVAGRVEESVKNTASAADFYARGLRTRVNQATPELLAELRAKLEKSLNMGTEGAPVSVKSVDESTFAEAKPGAFESYETDHFIVLHHNDALAKEVGQVVEAHLERIAGVTGLKTDWKEKPKIYLHHTQEEYTLATGQPEWTGGVSRFTHTPNGIANIQVHSWQTSPRLFKSVLPHELTHLIVNQSLPNYEALPRALHEGFSVLMEPDYRHNYYINFLRLRFKSQDFIPLSDLLRAKDYPLDPDFYYAEGFALIAYLVKIKGLDGALSLVRDPAKAGAIEDRILAIAGQEKLDKLESAWKQWITKGQ
ncbi:MAG: hypothetical protein HY291_06300 [Planctomycetes bacterium]|nr:hypothetical protein [Planctomycetota bacterium]